MKKNEYKKGNIILKLSNLNWKGTCLCLLILIVLESFYQLSEKNMNVAIDRIFGYIAFENYNIYLSSIIMFLFPQLGILLIWGNYFDNSIMENTDVIFTRTRKTARIVWKYVLELALGVTVMTGILESLLCIVYGMRGYVTEDIPSLLIDLLLYIVYINLIVLAVNIFSLVIKIMYSFLIVMSLQLVALQCIYMAQGNPFLIKVFYVIPSSAAMLYRNQNISSTSKILWLIYIIAISLLLGIVGCLIVRKKEFLK